ncbi:MAG: sigma-54-dependent Fis family transcriptional regulator [Desulfobacteraceae bacterium]|nr:sigma-54-dependent Fis family transcriptional regulator [Desulfobacteraceae bacterium]
MEDFEILFVDDEVEILDTVGEYLSQEGYKATLSDDGLKALGLVKERRFDVVFTDLKMPEFDGLELLAAIKEHRPETEVIIVTGYGTIESAIMAMKFGSYDYIQKPIKLDQLKMLCDKIMAEKKLKDENIFLKKSLKQRNRYEGLIGISPKMQETYEIIERIGRSSPSVLIQGEKGTGKELVARVIHKRSDRADKPFVPVNCSAIVEGSPESELFDHVTDLFDAAKGGTIFLDEVAEIPPSKLLQAFQQQDEPHEGANGEPEIDIRIIAATEKDPDQFVKNGTFREDLFYRLDLFSLKLPPLRDRREDICLLVNHFLAIYCNAAGEKALTISPEVMDIFLKHHWPGNVRQLENIIKGAIGAGVDKIIEVAHLPREMRKLAKGNGGEL